MAKGTIQKVQREIQIENISVTHISNSHPKCIKNKAIRLNLNRKMSNTQGIIIHIGTITSGNNLTSLVKLKIQSIA